MVEKSGPASPWGGGCGAPAVCPPGVGGRGEGVEEDSEGVSGSCCLIVVGAAWGSLWRGPFAAVPPGKTKGKSSVFPRAP